MNAPPLSAPRVEPFFFDADPGTRFSLYHAPAPHLPVRGAILYVHPFAEELNHSRRMATMQARRFAELGFAVLQIDLFGCGDSCGDFNAARWDWWKRDLGTARAWLADRCAGPLYLWGLRLGGLLALDYAASAPVDGLILWQPYLNGRSCINHFLRQRPGNPALLRAELLARGALEVGGYELTSVLAQAIDACDASALTLSACTVHCFAHPSRQRWNGSGATLQMHSVVGLPFWTGQVPDCPALLDATSAVFAP